MVRNIPKAMDFAADSAGNLWVVRNNGWVVRYNRKTKKWVDTGKKNGISITAGPKGHVYVLSSPHSGNGAFTIYSWKNKKWVAMGGKMVKSLAVGKRGRLWMIDSKDRVFFSQPNPRKTVCPAKVKARSGATVAPPRKEVKTSN